MSSKLRVLLINPPRVKGLPVVREERYEHRDVGSVYPPLSILQGAASLRHAGFDVKVGKFPFLGNSKATILGQHEGFIKVVADAKYGEILGVHAIGPLATEIIAEPVAALGLEATLDDMAATIHAHPTVWEAMGDAFNSVRGLSINY